MATNTRNDFRSLIAAALLVIAALTSACASSGANRPRPFPQPAGSSTPPPAPIPAAPELPDTTPPTPRATLPADQSLISTALSFRGTPYRSGGSDPRGFDCSGFTQWVFAQYGIALPREVEEQFKVGEKIKLDDLKPGDLVFFHTESRGVSHVGIFVADDQFVHAPSSKGVVRVEYVSSSYWARRFVGGRRVVLEQARASEPAAAKRRPSGEGSTAAAAAGARSAARDSTAAD